MSSFPSLPSKPLGGRYELLREVGRGGAAVVYVANDMQTERMVAVKVLREEVVNAVGRQRFIREIEMGPDLRHSHIVEMLEFGQSDGRFWYVMPYVEGGTLRQRLELESQLRTVQVVKWGAEIAGALAFAHARGYVHRDVKPENILLDGESAVLGDFGIARAIGADTLDTLTSAGIVIGTPAYMSPEQGSADKALDGRSDVYSLGCVLYECLAGVPPFVGPTAQSIISQRYRQSPHPLSTYRTTIPEHVNHAIDSALSLAPADRPTAHEFEEMLKIAEVLTVPRHVGRVASSAVSATSTTTPPSQLSGQAAREVKRASENNAAMAGQKRNDAARRWGIFVAASVLMALALATWWSMRGTSVDSKIAFPEPAVPGNAARVAVMPFENLSGDTALNYIANGLTTSLIDELAEVSALKVISKNGVSPYRGMTIGVDSIARALRVGSLVTGDVRRRGNRLSVTIRLVDGASGQLLATHDTTGTLADIIEFDSIVVAQAARFLRRRLGEQVRIANGRMRARSAEAWELVEQVRGLRESALPKTFGMRTDERFRQFAHADSMLIRARSRDSRWPEPDVLRGLLAMDQGSISLTLASPGPVASHRSLTVAEAFFREAEQHANAALARDRDDAGALHLRGLARMELWKTERVAGLDSLRDLAEKDLRDAVRARPSLATAWVDLSSLMQQSGEFGEARDAALAALDADAYLRSAGTVIARLQVASLGIGKTDEAQQWCREGQQRFSEDVRFYDCELTTLGWTGKTRADIDRAWHVLRQAEQRYDSAALQSAWVAHRLFVAAIAARAELPDSARAIVLRARAADTNLAHSSELDLNEAYVHAELNNPQVALRLLQRYLSNRPSRRRMVVRHPWFKNLRSEQAFAAMLAK